ncbi:hypothetical protein TruAng_007265 [Truncatella angustata]|nr:hypothetical protein TruAng_007265 [Truncatella angustata]
MVAGLQQPLVVHALAGILVIEACPEIANSQLRWMLGERRQKAEPHKPKKEKGLRLGFDRTREMRSQLIDLSVAIRPLAPSKRTEMAGSNGFGLATADAAGQHSASGHDLEGDMVLGVG